MKYSHRLSDAVHILVYIGICSTGDLSSATIAKSVDANPSLVRRLMATLVKSDILLSQPGISAPRLAKPADELSLLDIYLAVEEDPHLLHVDEKTNPDCLIGSNIQATLTAAYQQVQIAAQQEMAQITLQSLMDNLMERQAHSNAQSSAIEQQFAKFNQSN